MVVKMFINTAKMTDEEINKTIELLQIAKDSRDKLREDIKKTTDEMGKLLNLLPPPNSMGRSMGWSKDSWRQPKHSNNSSPFRDDDLINKLSTMSDDMLNEFEKFMDNTLKSEGMNNGEVRTLYNEAKEKAVMKRTQQQQQGSPKKHDIGL